MAAPIPDGLDSIGRDIYSRLGTIYETIGAYRMDDMLPSYESPEIRFHRSFLQALDAFRAQLERG